MKKEEFGPRCVISPMCALMSVLVSQGLALAIGDIVVRLDADDVCAPFRLSRQLEALEQAGPRLLAVGGAVTLFGEEDEHGEEDDEDEEDDGGGEDDGGAHHDGDCAGGEHDEAALAAPRSAGRASAWRSLRRTAVHPSEPLLVAWGLWWSCCVAHPAVAFRLRYAARAAAVLVVPTAATAGRPPAAAAPWLAVAPGGVATEDSASASASGAAAARAAAAQAPHLLRVSYRPSAAGAEDYDLWLRLSARRGGGVANLPCVVTHHRRHNGNATLKLRLRDADVAGAPASGELGASGLDERGNGGGREGEGSREKGSSGGEGIDDSGPAILSPAEAAAEWAAGAGERSSSSSGSSSGGEEREFSPRAGLAVGAFTAAAVEAPNAATAAAAAAAAAAALGPLAERGKSAALRVAAAHMAAALAEAAAARRRGGVSLRAAACARAKPGQRRKSPRCAGCSAQAAQAACSEQGTPAYTGGVRIQREPPSGSS